MRFTHRTVADKINLAHPLASHKAIPLRHHRGIKMLWIAAFVLFTTRKMR